MNARQAKKRTAAAYQRHARKSAAARLKKCASKRDLAQVHFNRALRSLINRENEYMLAWMGVERWKGR